MVLIIRLLQELAYFDADVVSQEIHTQAIKNLPYCKAHLFFDEEYIKYKTLATID